MAVKWNVGAGALSALVVLTLAGCGSTKLDTPAPVETRTPTDAGTGTSTDSGAGKPAAESNVASVDLSANANPPAGLGRTVYFDFDSYVIKDEYRPVVEGYAKFLAGNKAKRMLIEGHTDERGSREYNLALGQKRAEAVQKAMALVGAGEGQLEAVSFGEERPVEGGHDEAAWAKNRRAELKDR